MGVSIGDAGWAYSGFNRFRERLADHEGISLNAMQGFGGTVSWDDVATDLRPLLNHSDCDGDLSPEECAQVAPRLAVILIQWQRDEYDPVNLGCSYDIQNGFALVRSMQRCAEQGTRLEFT